MSKLEENFTGPTLKLPLSCTVISDVYMSFIPNKSTSTKYCLTQLFSKLLFSLYFQINLHLLGIVLLSWFQNFSGALKSTEVVRQYLINLTDLMGIVNATVYKTESKLSQPHGVRCLHGSLCRHGISGHGIDFVCPDYFGFSTRSLIS